MGARTRCGWGQPRSGEVCASPHPAAITARSASPAENLFALAEKLFQSAPTIFNTGNGPGFRADMNPILFTLAVSFGGGVIFASFFEWTLHRFVMHRPIWGFDYSFKAHALVHHHTFKADHTYHLINEKDKETIPMAWWNGPAIVLTGMVPVGLIAWALGNWTITIGAFVAFCLYFAAYEYMHWCMHLPKARRVEKSWIFHRLNGHHLLHHRYMHKNFNVVMPLADLCLGTLLLRSRIKFPQATGPAVPDVQPREAKAAA